MTVMEHTWSPEPIRAWRYWSHIRADGVLHGSQKPWKSAAYEAGTHEINGDVSWQIAMRALDRMRDNGETFNPAVLTTHASPQWGCLCGINATKALDRRTAVSVVGSLRLNDEKPSMWIGPRDRGVRIWAFAPVHLTGTVHEYELGYRAEKAEIVEQITVVMDADTPVVFDDTTRQAMEERYGVPVVVRTIGDVLNEWAVLEEQEQDNGHGATRSGNRSAARASAYSFAVGGTVPSRTSSSSFTLPPFPPGRYSVTVKTPESTRRERLTAWWRNDGKELAILVGPLVALMGLALFNLFVVAGGMS